MKLEGSLDAFSLPDVFQLLSLTKKSGGLHLANGQARGIVYFASGVVTGASSDAAQQSLPRRLVGLDACDDSALRRAVERASAEDVGVARALAEAGAVDPDLLNRLALEETIDAIFDLLRWTDGDFAFGVDEANPDDVGLAVAADFVVTEATSRRETWDAVSRIIPSPEVVLAMPVVVAEPPAVGGEEWALLALVDGRRSVGELVELSGAGQFTVVSTLAALVQRGLLILQDDESPDYVTRVRRRHQLLAPLEASTVEDANPESEPQQDPSTAALGDAGSATQASIATTAGSSTAPEVTGSPVPDSGASPQTGSPTGEPAAPMAPAARAQDPAADAVLGGAHDPVNVVPPRPEPFMPKRVVDHPEPAHAETGRTEPARTQPAGPEQARPEQARAEQARAEQARPDQARGGFSSPVLPPTAMASAAHGASAAAQPVGDTAIERDPTVNRSLMLRLIAGVRGL